MTDHLTTVSELQRHIEQRVYERPRLRSHHNRLVSEVKCLGALLEKLKIPSDPEIFNERGETAFLLECYCDLLRCIFKGVEPLAEQIAANAADYAGAKIEDYALVHGALTDFLAPIKNAIEELREPLQP